MGNKSIGIVCCSNGQKHSYKADIDKLYLIFREKGIDVMLGDYIYETNGISSGTPQQRASQLMQMFYDNISNIFDVSGGDIANEILDYLDYSVISKSNSTFWGYSDLTTVINAIYAETGKKSVLYQIKNLIWDMKGIQLNRFWHDNNLDYKNISNNALFGLEYTLVQGNAVSGVVVGGNVRCLLKLAGTKYFPDMKGKVLLLEALSGDEAQLRTYFAQLKQLRVFEDINGLMLGTFTEYQKNHKVSDLLDIIREYVGESITIIKTEEIGHDIMAKAIIIGMEYSFS